MLKNREGEEQDFVTNFNFYPVDFAETTYPPPLTPMAQGAA
jgi:hypothetical protein